MDLELHQEADRPRAGAIWLVALGFVVLTAALVGVAWWLVRSPAATLHPAGAPSTLEHELYERARGGDDARDAAARRLERTEWVDRGARVARIPIERAIDAAVADPTLIGGHR